MDHPIKISYYERMVIVMAIVAALLAILVLSVKVATGVLIWPILPAVGVFGTYALVNFPYAKMLALPR